MLPLLCLTSLIIFESSSILKHISFMLSYCFVTSSSPSKILFTLSYVIRKAVFITDLYVSAETTFPSGVISISQVKVSLSSFGFNEQIPFEISFGSIGRTLSTR